MNLLNRLFTARRRTSGPATRLGGVITNTAFSMAADLFNRLANTLVFILLSRALSISDAGAYSLAFSYMLLTSRFAYWGLDDLIIREMTRTPEQANRYFVNYLAIRTTLALIATSVAAVIIFQLPYQLSTQLAIVAMLSNVLPDALYNICQAAFINFERMRFLGNIAFVNSLLKLAVAWLAVRAGYGVVGVAIGFNLVSWITLASALITINRRFFRISLDLNLRFCLKQMKMAGPYILIGIFFIIDNRADVLVLSLMQDEATVAYYSTAITIITALAMLPQGIRNAIYPMLARTQATQKDATKPLYRQMFRYMLLLVLPLTVGTALVAPQIITLLFSRRFVAAGPILQILSWSFLLYSLNVLNSRLLIASNRQHLLVVFLICGLSVNLLLILLLVPAYGMIGAAVAKVASALTNFTLCELVTGKLLGKLELPSLVVHPALAALVMAVAVILVRPGGLIVQVATGMLAYGAMLMLLRTFSTEEQRMWRQTLRKLVY